MSSIPQRLLMIRGYRLAVIANSDVEGYLAP
jgi:hypothetical protein